MSVQAFECPECGHMKAGNIRCYNCANPLNKKGDPYAVPTENDLVVRLTAENAALKADALPSVGEAD